MRSTVAGLALIGLALAGCSASTPASPAATVAASATSETTTRPTLTDAQYADQVRGNPQYSNHSDERIISLGESICETWVRAPDPVHYEELIVILTGAGDTRLGAIQLAGQSIRHFCPRYAKYIPEG